MGRVLFWIVFFTSFSSVIFASEEKAIFDVGQEEQGTAHESFGDFSFDDKTGSGTQAAESETTAAWWNNIRSELTFENAFATSDAEQTNSRFILRTQLEELLSNKWYFQFDGKANLFMLDDHITADEDKHVSLRYDIREAYIQTGIGSTSILFGYQVLVWSEMLSLSVVDITNAFNQTEFVYRERDYTRMGEPMLIIDQFDDDLQYTFYLKPSKTVNDIPRYGSHMDITPYHPAVFDVHRQHDQDYETGFRVRRSNSKSEFSIVGGYINDDQGVYEIAGLDQSGRVQMDKIHNSYKFLGAVGNFTVDRFTFKGELGLKQDKLFQRNQVQGVLPPNQARDSQVLAGSFEYITTDTYFYSFEYSVTKINDWQQDLTQDEYRRELFAIFNKRYVNDTLTTQWTYYRDLDMDFAFHELKLFYEVNSEFTVGGFYHHFDLGDEDQFPIQDPNRITAHFILYF